MTPECTFDFIFDPYSKCPVFSPTQRRSGKMLRKVHFLLFSLPPLALSAGRKNVLFIGSDDMRTNLNLYSDVTDGVFASPTMHTPNLDKVAKVSSEKWKCELKIPPPSWERGAWCLSQRTCSRLFAAPVGPPWWPAEGFWWSMWWQYDAYMMLTSGRFWSTLLGQYRIRMCGTR